VLNRLLLPLLAISVVFPLLNAASAAELAAGEKEKLEALLSKIENLKDAVFVRNGSEYDAKTAVKFLRGKWESSAAQIATARDFIEKAASVSSTSGKPYLIRFKNGTEKKCAEFLTAELAELEKAAK
jgi:hypothetical protein